jgi:hypothetical protein
MEPSLLLTVLFLVAFRLTEVIPGIFGSYKPFLSWRFGGIRRRPSIKGFEDTRRCKRDCRLTRR